MEPEDTSLLDEILAQLDIADYLGKEHENHSDELEDFFGRENSAE